MTSIRYAKKHGLGDFAPDAEGRFEGNADLYLRPNLTPSEQDFLIQELGMRDDRLAMMQKYGGRMVRKPHPDMVLGEVVTGRFKIVYQLGDEQEWRALDEAYTLPSHYFTAAHPKLIAA